MRTQGHGLSIEVPLGWEARIVRRAPSPAYLHVASFPLRADTGQFGAAVTSAMGADGAFAALVRYAVDDQVRPGEGLFSSSSARPPRLAEFGPSQLQVARPGHLGAQRFFTRAGRPYCLYAVIAPVRRRPAALAGELAAVLQTLRFED